MSISQVFSEIEAVLERMAGRIGLLENNQQTRTHNQVTNTAPGVNDDDTAGFSILSMWADTSTSPNDIYICRDNATGAADWAVIA